MEENKVIHTLRLVGIIEAIVCGLAGVFMLGSSIMGVVVIFAAIVTCAMFFGFADIIRYLQLNAYYQKEILHLLQKTKVEEPAQPSKANIVEIESALPEL